MNGPLRCLLLFAIASGLFGQVPELSGQSGRIKEIERRIGLLAAETAVKEEIERLRKSNEVDKDLTSQLQNEMLANVARHARRLSSRTASRVFVAQQVRQEFDNRSAKLCQDRGVTMDQLKEHYPGYNREVSLAVDSHVQAVQTAHYTRAREQAVAIQSKQIAWKMPYPKIYEADQYLADWDKGRPELVKKLVDSALEGREIFEECREEGATAAGNIANNIRLEYENQRKELLRVLDDARVPAVSITAAAIRKHGAENMETYLAQDDREGVPAYREMFPSLLALADQTAAELEIDRFAAHLKSSTPFFAEDEPDTWFRDQFLQQIRTAPGRHRVLRDSRDALAQQMQTQAEQFLIGTHVASQPEEARAELHEYFRRLLFEQSGHQSLVLERLKTLWDQKLPEIRKDYAASQLEEHFAMLVMWTPAEDSVTEVYDRSYRMPLSYDRAVPFLELAEKPAGLIEETELAVRDAVRAKLTLHRDALSCQLNDLRKQEQDSKEGLQKIVREGKVRKEDLIATWRASVERRWEQQIAENESFRGIPIFERTHEELVKIVSQYYDSFQQAAASPTNGGGSGGEDGSSAVPDGEMRNDQAASTQPHDSPDDSPAGQPAADPQDGGPPVPPGKWIPYRPGQGGGHGEGTGNGSGGDGEGSGGRGSPDRQGTQPDIVLTIADREADGIRANWEPGGGISLDLRATDAGIAASRLAAAIEQVLRETIREKQSAAPADPADEPIVVRFHLKVSGTNFRYVTGIYLREQLEKICREAGQGVRLVWSDGR